jgi:hypothetical protein
VRCNAHRSVVVIKNSCHFYGCYTVTDFAHSESSIGFNRRSVYFQYSSFCIIEQTIIKEFIFAKARLSNYFKVLQKVSELMYSNVSVFDLRMSVYYVSLNNNRQEMFELYERDLL